MDIAKTSILDRRTSLRKAAVLGIKFAVTVGLCVWIITWVDWQQFWSAIRLVNVWILLVILPMRFFGIVISTYKWQRLLAIHNLCYPLSQLLRWYLISMFANNFLPSHIGGDAYRIYKTWSNPRGGSCAVNAVFVERATGILALLTLGGIASIVILTRTRDQIASFVLETITIGMLIGVGTLYAFARFRVLRRLAKSRYFPKAAALLIELADDLRRRPRELIRVGIISFVFHANKICVLWLLLFSLGAAANICNLVVAVCAVEVAGVLPVTLAGWGIVEGTFMFVMGHFGTGYATALAAMLLSRVMLLPVSLIGAYWYFVGDRPNTSTKGVVRDLIDTRANL